MLLVHHVTNPNVYVWQRFKENSSLIIATEATLFKNLKLTFFFLFVEGEGALASCRRFGLITRVGEGDRLSDGERLL